MVVEIVVVEIVVVVVVVVVVEIVVVVVVVVVLVVLVVPTTSGGSNSSTSYSRFSSLNTPSSIRIYAITVLHLYKNTHQCMLITYVYLHTH